MANEADLHKTKLEWKDALRLYEIVVAEAPQWSRGHYELGNVLLELARFSEAELHLQAALKQATDDEGLSFCTNSLGLYFLARARWDEAEPLLVQSLGLAEKVYGPGHSYFAPLLDNLARLLHDTNRVAEAEPLLRRALAINEQFSGPEHADVAIILYNLAQLLQATDRLADAEPLYRRALSIHEQSYGAEHPAVAIDLGNLADLLIDANRLAEAESLMRRALVIDEQSYGAEHINVSRRLNNLVNWLMFRDTNRAVEAEPLMRRALTICALRVGPEHPGTMTFVENYRRLLAELKVDSADIEHRVQSTMLNPGELTSIVPTVERLLGPAMPVAEALAALDRQYKTEGMPAIYTLSPDEPIAPHLQELLTPTPDSINTVGVLAFRNGDHANAIVWRTDGSRAGLSSWDDLYSQIVKLVSDQVPRRRAGRVEAQTQTDRGVDLLSTISAARCNRN